MRRLKHSHKRGIARRLRTGSLASVPSRKGGSALVGLANTKPDFRGLKRKAKPRSPKGGVP